MLTLTISQIYIIIFILIALTIVVAIIEWFHLETLSTELSSLECDVEKKSQEFDAIRKERSALPRGHTIYPHTSETIEPHSSSENTSEIQIMRNVGGTFKDTSLLELESQKLTALSDSGTSDLQGLQQISKPSLNPQEFSEPVTQKYVKSPGGTQNYTESQKINPYTQKQFVQNQVKKTPGSQTVNAGLVPNNASRNAGTQINNYQARPETAPQIQNITLYLYSDTLKDADFNGLGQKLSQYCSSGYPVAITIDFSGIHFIYDNEIQYLEDLCKYIEDSKGTVILSSCDQELVSLVQNHPKIISRISV